MDSISILRKLKNGSEGVVEMLDLLKSKRMGGAKSNYIPSVEEVASVIKSIPIGQTKTITELRSGLAKISNNDTASPVTYPVHSARHLKYSNHLKVLYPKNILPKIQAKGVCKGIRYL